MANNRVYMSKDAAGIEPKLIPDYELLARDDSGGPDWQPYTAQFGDGEYKHGQEDKGHLSAKGGAQHDLQGDEQASTLKTRSGNNEMRAPAISNKRAKE